MSFVTGLLALTDAVNLGSKIEKVRSGCRSMIEKAKEKLGHGQKNEAGKKEEASSAETPKD